MSIFKKIKKGSWNVRAERYKSYGLCNNELSN